jgi:hypothetical protein
MKQKTESRKFKELILDMYRGFPRWYYVGMIEPFIPLATDRENFVRLGFLIQKEVDGKTVYGLGPNALSIVSAWETEHLTRQMHWLTWVMVVLAVLQAIFILAQWITQIP